MNIKAYLFKFVSKVKFLNKLYIRAAFIKNQLVQYIGLMLPIYKQKMLFPKSVFLVFTPEHDNLGDHAIAYAEKLLFDSLGIKYFEISEYQLRYIQKLSKLDCFNNTTVFIHGGGYLGTIWFDCELLLRDLVLANPKARFLAFPNTIYYDKTEFGKSEFEKSKSIYNTHSDLTLYAREKYSYEIMKEAYYRVKLTPDVVFSLNESATPANRKGCLLCLRNDIEKTITDEQKKALLIKTQLLFGESYAFTDMSNSKWISAEERETALSEKFNEFRSAELVITDRLHGMIFCAITGTPCIVINSKSHKVKGCYEWIKDLEYIHFAYDIEQIPEIYHSIPKKVFKYNNQKFEPMFNQLKNDIANCVNKNSHKK